MNKACELCRGACCESIVLNVPTGDVGVWLRYHGEPVGIHGQQVELATPCRMLCDGKCSIWQHRPANCANYQVGSPACRDTVKRRRENWREIFAAMT